MRFLAVAWKEFIHILRDKRAFILTLVFPAFTVSFLGYAITLDIKRIKIGLIEEDRIVGENIKRKIEGSTYFELIPVLNLKEGEELIRRGKITILINIKEDTYASIARNLSVPLDLLVDGSDSNSATIVQGYLFQMFYEFERENRRPRLKFLYNPELSSRKFFVPGLIGIFLFVLAVAMTAQAVVREKEKGTMESLRVSPITPGEIIAGKILPYILIGLCDFLIGLLFAYLLFDVRCEGSFISLTFSTFLFITTGISIGIFVSTLTASTMVAWLITFIITVLPSLILSDFIFPTTSMPGAKELYSRLIPTKYYIKLIRFIILKGTSLIFLWKEVFVLIIFFLFFFTASIIRLGREL